MVARDVLTCTVHSDGTARVFDVADDVQECTSHASLSAKEHCSELCAAKHTRALHSKKIT